MQKALSCPQLLISHLFRGVSVDIVGGHKDKVAFPHHLACEDAVGVMHRHGAKSAFPAERRGQPRCRVERTLKRRGSKPPSRRADTETRWNAKHRFPQESCLPSEATEEHEQCGQGCHRECSAGAGGCLHESWKKCPLS